jgi:hypothetical protein
LGVSVGLEDVSSKPTATPKEPILYSMIYLYNEYCRGFIRRNASKQKNWPVRMAACQVFRA